jgi:prepilin-type N-terminal cleavage/methylation domain-containing protein
VIKKFKAFSLIELMVVIAIVGILSVTAFPAYKKYIDKANMLELASLIQQEKAVMMQQFITGMPVTGDTTLSNDYGSILSVTQFSGLLQFRILLTPAASGGFSFLTADATPAVMLIEGTYAQNPNLYDSNSSDLIVWTCTLISPFGSSDAHSFLQYFPEGFNCSAS